jgi:hypothetical protein
MAMSKKTIYRVTFLLFSSVCGLAITEIGLRLFYPQALGVWYKTKDDLTILRPNFKGVAKGIETVQEIQTNSIGMRDREHEVEADKGVLRVMVLGDSHMEALQMKFEHSFPRLLEDKLRALLSREVEVINVAVSGWGTDEQVTYFSRYGKKFKPNLVLLAVTLHNDISDNLEQNFHVFVDGKLASKSVQITPDVEYKIWQLKAFLGAQFHAYQLLRVWWHAKGLTEGGQQLNSHVAGLVRKESPEQINKGWQMTRQLLVKLKGEAAQIDAQLAMFLIPLSMQLDEEKLRGFLSDNHLSSSAVDIERPQRLMKEFMDDAHIEVIDLLPCFREWEMTHRKALFLKYDGHWTEDGHDLASSVVSQALVRRAILKTPTKTGIAPESQACG